MKKARTTGDEAWLAWRRECDKRACCECIFQIARALDRCDEPLLRSLFHADATDDHGFFQGTASEFADWVFPLLGTMERTQHLIGNVLVDVSDDEAVSESAFVAYHDLSGPDGHPLRMISAGRYLDRFQRRDGVWKCCHRQVVYDWSQTTPRNDMWDRSPESPREFGRRDRTDALYAHLASLPIAR